MAIERLVRCEAVSDEQMAAWLRSIKGTEPTPRSIPLVVGVPLAQAQCRTNGSIGYRGDVVRSISTAAKTGARPEWLGPWYTRPVGPDLPPGDKPWPMWGWFVAGAVGVTALRMIF